MSTPSKGATWSRRDWTQIQRRKRFRKLYLQSSNALQSALAAGYSPTTAVTCSARWAAQISHSLQDEVEYAGYSKPALITKLITFLSAKQPKWNHATEKWDYFEDFGVQLAAWDRMKELIQPKEIEPPDPTMKIGVAIDQEDNREEWEKRNRTRVVVTVQTGREPETRSSPEAEGPQEKNITPDHGKANGGGKGGGGGIRQEMETTRGAAT